MFFTHFQYFIPLKIEQERVKKSTCLNHFSSCTSFSINHFFIFYSICEIVHNIYIQICHASIRSKYFSKVEMWNIAYFFIILSSSAITFPSHIYHTIIHTIFHNHLQIPQSSLRFSHSSLIPQFTLLSITSLKHLLYSSIFPYSLFKIFHILQYSPKHSHWNSTAPKNLFFYSHKETQSHFHIPPGCKCNFLYFSKTIQVKLGASVVL